MISAAEVWAISRVVCERKTLQDGRVWWQFRNGEQWIWSEGPCDPSYILEAPDVHVYTTAKIDDARIAEPQSVKLTSMRACQRRFSVEESHAMASLYGQATCQTLREEGKER